LLTGEFKGVTVSIRQGMMLPKLCGALSGKFLNLLSAHITDLWKNLRIPYSPDTGADRKAM